MTPPPPAIDYYGYRSIVQNSRHCLDVTLKASGLYLEFKAKWEFCSSKTHSHFSFQGIMVYSHYAGKVWYLNFENLYQFLFVENIFFGKDYHVYNTRACMRNGLHTAGNLARLKFYTRRNKKCTCTYPVQNLIELTGNTVIAQQRSTCLQCRQHYWYHGVERPKSPSAQI